MMQYFKILSAFALYVNMHAWAQTCVIPAQQMHELDTILYIPSICRNDANLKGFNYCYGEDGKLFLNYYNPSIHGDTFRIIQVHSTTYCIDSFDVLIKNGSEIFQEGIQGFAIHSQQLAILLAGRLLYIESWGNLGFRSYKSFGFKDGIGYQKICFTTGQQLLLARSYNYKRGTDKNPKTKICLLDVKKLQEIKSISPPISLIAMSHMQPFNIISITSEGVLVGQVHNYEVVIYNTQLQEIETLSEKQKFLNYNTLDTSEVLKVDRLSNTNVSALITYLQPKFSNGYALVDGCFLLNKHTLLIRYTLGDLARDTIGRYFDLWRYNPNKLRFMVSDTSFELRIPSLVNPLSLDTLHKKNYFVNFWLNPSFFSANQTYVFSKGMNHYPIGRSSAELKEMEKTYYQKHDAIFTLSILKNKF